MHQHLLPSQVTVKSSLMINFAAKVAIFGGDAYTQAFWPLVNYLY